MSTSFSLPFGLCTFRSSDLPVVDGRSVRWPGQIDVWRSSIVRLVDRTHCSASIAAHCHVLVGSLVLHHSLSFEQEQCQSTHVSVNSTPLSLSLSRCI